MERRRETFVCRFLADPHAMAAPQLLDLPEELLVRIATQISIDPNAASHLGALPLVCVAFRDVCAGRVVAAVRLMARVHAVVKETTDEMVLDEVMACRVWSAAADVHNFIVCGGSETKSQRAAALMRTDTGAADCLHTLLHRCSLGESKFPPPPPGAEGLFSASEASRFNTQVGLIATSSPPQRQPQRSSPNSAPQRSGQRGTSMRTAESAAFAREMVKRQLVAAEMERQASRQLGAHCRRQWKQMPMSERLAWAKYAEEMRDKWERHRQAARAAAHVASKLNSVFSSVSLEIAGT
eukprot:scaffold68401_cov35-Tisochrysis_lutea.AAC.1